MFVRLKDGKSLDSKFDPKIKKIDIVAPGIVVRGDDKDDTRTFYPWHAIEFVLGQHGEYEHELEQFSYLGIADA